MVSFDPPSLPFPPPHGSTGPINTAQVMRVIPDQLIFQPKEVSRGMYVLTKGVFDITTADLQSYIIGPDVD